MRAALREEWLSLIIALAFGAGAFFYSMWDLHIGATLCGLASGLWASSFLDACRG